MGDANDKCVQSLEEIMRTLADVWPGDRDNIMQAGARLEETIEEFEGKSTLLNELIGLAWKALIHLYEKDDFFFSIRAATLQAVNTIREFAVHDGDIAVEVFEKASSDLQKALAGEAESAISEGEAAAPAESEMSADPAPQNEKKQSPADPAGKEALGDDEDHGEPDTQTGAEIPEVTLSDLASVIMQLPDDTLSAAHIEQIANLVSFLKEHCRPPICAVLSDIQETIAGLEGREPEDPAGFLSDLSAKVDKVVQLDMNDELGQEEQSPGADGKETADQQAESGRITDISQQSVDDPQPEINEQAEGGQQTGDSYSRDFTVPDDLDVTLLTDFITECNEQIEEAESALLDLETSPDDDELIHKVFRSFHTIKGTSAFMGLTPVSEFAHAVETLLDMVRDDHIPYDSACADITLNAIDIVKSFLEKSEQLSGGDVLSMPEEYPPMMRTLIQIAEFGKKPEQALAEETGSGARKQAGPASSESNSEPKKEQTAGDAEDSGLDVSGEAAGDPVQSDRSAPEKSANAPTGSPDTPAENDRNGAPSGNREADGPGANGSPKSSKARAESDVTVRVNVERLDRVIDMVGELVIAHSVVAQDSNIAADPDLSRKVTHSTKILRELQDTSLTLRMVPLKATFQKMNRLVRDLSKKSGKTVSYATEGEDTEIDRNMVDIINEPLVHLLRNALDHGIEDAETRQKKGKSGIAKIWLRAFQAGGKVIIEIEDDGKGLDKDKILSKAVSKGLVEPNKKLTDSEIYKLIFLPGFSTAEKVSDLSGRGVGMDVVRKSIDRLQGKVDVSSRPGDGTKISLELPFTLAITDGMLVRIGSQQFIVPTINIDMTFRAEQDDLFTVLGDAEHVRFRGNSIPLIRLHRMFDIRDAIEDVHEATLLVINNNKKKYALLVDEVVGQQQLVGKSIDMPVKMRNISGGAILGDGRVGLILDTVALLN